MVFGFGNNTVPTPTTGFRSSQGFGGFNIGNGIRSTVGNVLKKEFSYSQIFSNLVMFQQTLSTFDWNLTDAELRKRYENYQTQIAGQMGALVGRGIGSTLSVALGGAAGITVPKISSGQLAKRLMQAGTEVAREEIMEEVESTMLGIRGMAVNLAAIELYIDVRNFLKTKVPRAVLEQIYGKQTTDFILYTWGEEDADSLILQEELEEKIESITNPKIRAFIEEAAEEFFDSMIEVGFVIAGELDSALREFQLDRAQNSTDRIITLQTVADEPNSERFIVSTDNYEEAQDEIRTTLQQWRIMQNRNVGQIITQDIEILEQHPQLRRLEITFRSKPFPPFVESDGKPSKTTTLTIPNFKHPIRWQEIKTELKYNSTVPSYIWGDSVAVLKFTDKRKIKICYSSVQMTKQQVETLLKSFADLSNGIIKTITVNEYVELPTQLRDSPIGMYPVSCKIIARNLTNLNRANANQMPEVSYEFPLWTTNEPSDFDEFINAPIPIGNP